MKETKPTMNKTTVQQILGEIDIPEDQAHLIEILRTHLGCDNNKLREDFVCSLLGYTPSFGGAGYPDGYTQTQQPVDCKSGPNVIFPDGFKSIAKKADWLIIVSEYTNDGKLIYVAEFPMLEIMDELIDDVDKKTKKLSTTKPSRISPSVSSKVWLTKDVVVRYKNKSLFKTNKNGKLNKFYTQLDQLPVG